VTNMAASSMHDKRDNRITLVLKKVRPRHTKRNKPGRRIAPEAEEERTHAVTATLGALRRSSRSPLRRIRGDGPQRPRVGIVRVARRPREAVCGFFLVFPRPKPHYLLRAALRARSARPGNNTAVAWRSPGPPHTQAIPDEVGDPSPEDQP